MSAFIEWLKSPAPPWLYWVDYALVALWFGFMIYSIVRTIQKGGRRGLISYYAYDFYDHVMPPPLTMPSIVGLGEPKKHASTAEFAGKEIEFGVGFVMGTRSFRVTVDGNLVGVVFHDKWEPGTNEAVCHTNPENVYPVIVQLYNYRKQQEDKLYALIYTKRNMPPAYKLDEKQVTWNPKAEADDIPSSQLRVTPYQPGAPGDPEYDKIKGNIDEATSRLRTVYDMVEAYQKSKHSLDECTCGFYGYYEGSNDYYSEGMVMAVVKGTGELVLGTRGFKAEKAEIVALHIPDAVHKDTIAKIISNYPDIPLFGSFSAMVAEFPPTGDID